MQNRLQTNAQFIQRSMEIILNHKCFLILPLINLIINIGLFVLIFTPLVQFEKSLWEQNAHPGGKTIFIFCVIFLIYLTISSLISLLFHVAQSSYAIKHINNEPCTLRSCFIRALKNIKQIYYYKLLCDTFFPVIRLLEYWMDTWPNTKFATQTLSQLPFRVAMYLAIPILSNEKTPAFQALKRSAQLIKNTWGISLRPRMTMNATMIWLHVLSLIPILTAIIIGGKIILIIGTVISVILFFCVSTLYTTAHIILTSALYLFALKNKNTARFYEDSLLDNAFQPKS